MLMLDLFSGLEGASQAMGNRGWKVVTVDNEPKFEPDLWLEPYDIGGHALLTGNNQKKGCLECLFTPNGDSDTFAFGNRAAFASEGQSFSSDISGCANRFTPYGSVDAAQTAILGTRLAVKTLLGEVSDNPLQSWKGSPDDFLGAGYDLSNRYHLTESELEDRQLKYKNPNCPVCGDNADS